MVHLIHWKLVALLHNTVLILCDEGDGLVAMFTVVMYPCHQLSGAMYTQYDCSMQYSWNQQLFVTASRLDYEYQMSQARSKKLLNLAQGTI